MLRSITCVASLCATVVVTPASLAGAPAHKVPMCHHNQSKHGLPFVTIVVDVAAVPAHLRRDDFVGVCPNKPPHHDPPANASVDVSATAATPPAKPDGIGDDASGARNDGKSNGDDPHGQSGSDHGKGQDNGAPAADGHGSDAAGPQNDGKSNADDQHGQAGSDHGKGQDPAAPAPAPPTPGPANGNAGGNGTGNANGHNK